MTKHTENALLRVALMVFEDVCFLQPTEGIGPEQSSSPLEAEVDVSFHGPAEGTVSVRLYGRLLGSLASAMRGEDVGYSPDLWKDALGEVGNIICGNLLPEVISREVFRLGVPKVRLGESGSSQPLNGEQASASVGLDGGRAELQISLKSGKFVEE